MSSPLFEKVALVGIGLVGSSLARIIRREGLADHVAISTRSAATLQRAEEIGLGGSYHADAAECAQNADLVVMSVPVGASGPVARRIAPALKPGAILTDAGSTKGSVVRDVAPTCPMAFISYRGTRSPEPSNPAPTPGLPPFSKAGGAF